MEIQIDMEKPKRKPTTQESIIRQSSLKAAVDYTKDSELTPDQVLEISEQFEKWVNREI